MTIRPFHFGWPGALLSVAIVLAPVWAKPGKRVTSGPRRVQQNGVQRVVAKIDAVKRSTNRNIARYGKVQKSVEGTDNGGNLTAWLAGPSVKKMAVSLWMSNRKEDSVYYFHDGRLVLVIQRDQLFGWDAQKQEIDPGNPQPPIENKYYFRGGTIIRSVRTPRYARSAMLRERPAARLMIDAKWFSKQVRARDNVIQLPG